MVKLILAPDNLIPGRRQTPPPPPELVEGKEEYIVEEVLNSRLFHQKIQYLVKWEGYGVKHNTWEYLDHLNNALDKVAEFYMRHSLWDPRGGKNLPLISTEMDVNSDSFRWIFQLFMYKLIPSKALICVEISNLKYK